ncbi:hypothetical protein M2323_001045 [Rhodoblastus acidophilus]|uniref:hypothetical protein n=1 Tax=Rhodoblastus acidophilus TaxID=1074 RepID=UPI0022248B1E|nr:hypothetical protein [Rhodoblastus acidophilus]MCW2283276.1 hypothetical protein [Rhodoblastus acidophilus]MCW2332136.1 hypothetical protein [Rhodoblastus acidophilus]
MKPGPDIETDLANALERAAEALGLTCARLTRVESAMSALMRLAGPAAMAHCADLQELDRSAQEVASLAEFIGQLARRTPDAVLVDVTDVTRNIPLDDLARFLGRAPAQAPPPSQDEEIFFAEDARVDQP